MNTPLTSNPYKRHRFPAEIISHCVWLYFRFCLSYRDVEELMAERGVTLTYEAVRYWCRKFGQPYRGMSSRRTDFYATGLVIKNGVGDRKPLSM
jgi:putative transposase